MTAIFKKEFKGYLTSMIGYVFIFFILLLEGIYFTAYNIQQSYPIFGITLNAITFIFLLLVPVLTMKVVAEERKQKTDQLLLTAPVSVGKIIMGKYLALLAVFLIPVAIICTYPLILGKYGTISYAMAYTSILGFVLLGSCADCGRRIFIFDNRESRNCSSYDVYRSLCLLYDHRNCYIDPGNFRFFSGNLYVADSGSGNDHLSYDKKSVDCRGNRYRGGSSFTDCILCETHLI